MINLQPGVHENIPEAEYRALPQISKSGLDQWVSPRKFGRNVLVGQAIHKVALEGREALRAAFTTAAADLDLRKPENRKAMEALARTTGKTVLRPKERDRVAQMYAALMADEKAAQVLSTPCPRELTVIAQLPDSKVEAKCRIDLLLPTAIVDLKSTHYPTPDMFVDAIAGFNYAAQAAFYTDCYAAAAGKHLPFVWLCVSSSAPHDVWCTKCTNEQLAYGRSWYKAVLTLYERYRFSKGEGDE